eukprot:12690977-Alexandrium_andersonii.AAC.1
MCAFRRLSSLLSLAVLLPPQCPSALAACMAVPHPVWLALRRRPCFLGRRPLGSGRVCHSPA